MLLTKFKPVKSYIILFYICNSAAAQPGNLVNRKDEEIFELNSLLADVLQEKEDMQKKYEQRIREMEEQVALANQQKAGPPTSKPTLR